MQYRTQHYAILYYTTLCDFCFSIIFHIYTNINILPNFKMHSHIKKNIYIRTKYIYIRILTQTQCSLIHSMQCLWATLKVVSFVQNITMLIYSIIHYLLFFIILSVNDNKRFRIFF